MNFDLKKLVIVFFVFSLLFLIESSIFAQTTSNPEIIKYLTIAKEAKSTSEQIQNYMFAANAVNKKLLTKDNAILLANINYAIGRDAINIMDFKVAIKAFEKSYYYLKLKKIHKNNKLAFLDLLQISTIAQMCNDEEAVTNYLEELVKTQTAFEKSDPCEFKSIYYTLSNLYSKSNNLNKANYYHKKALNLDKCSTQKQESNKFL